MRSTSNSIPSSPPPETDESECVESDPSDSAYSESSADTSDSDPDSTKTESESSGSAGNDDVNNSQMSVTVLKFIGLLILLCIVGSMGYYFCWRGGKEPVCSESGPTQPDAGDKTNLTALKPNTEISDALFSKKATLGMNIYAVTPTAPVMSNTTSTAPNNSDSNDALA